MLGDRHSDLHPALRPVGLRVRQPAGSDAGLGHGGQAIGRNVLTYYDVIFTEVPGRLCVGDCNNDQSITIDDILTLVNMALGNANVSTCLAGDANHDNQITVDEILTAVNNALNGCQ
jgi:hypothetical protein